MKQGIGKREREQGMKWKMRTRSGGRTLPAIFEFWVSIFPYIEKKSFKLHLGGIDCTSCLLWSFTGEQLATVAAMEVITKCLRLIQKLF